MTANGEVSLVFGDGEYLFNIAKVAQVLELEEKCNAGLGEVFARLMSAEDVRNARWHFNDMREPIRLGLIGGGMSPAAALKLVQRYVDARPFQENVPVARTVLMVALVGVPGDQPGKTEADRAATESAFTTNGAASSDPQSTALAPVLDGTQDIPMKQPSGSLPLASTATTPPKAQSPNPTP